MRSRTLKNKYITCVPGKNLVSFGSSFGLSYVTPRLSYAAKQRLIAPGVVLDNLPPVVNATNLSANLVTDQMTVDTQPPAVNTDNLVASLV